MAERAAIVTGASRGIGRAIAEVLADEGFDLTVSARKPESLERAAEELATRGVEVQPVAANLAGDEDAVKSVVDAHRERFGRLDMLVNNAGIGIGAPAGEHQSKYVDMQLNLNLRSIILFYRECLPMLREAGAEHKNAWVVNLASIAGKSPAAWLSVYSATKAGVIGYTRAMNAELSGDGIKSVAFCPGFVDTDMADFAKGQVPADEMIRPSDIGEGVRFILRLSPIVVIPDIVFSRPGEFM
jgi:NAD(P)-dependent dehydrogenase (short-subunit alcohol dehydrogenase family)